MNHDELRRLFPNASKSCLAANADSPAEAIVDKDYHADNVSSQKMKPPRPYSEAENVMIRAYYRDRAGVGIFLDDLAKKVGRSRWSVAMQASRLGLCDRTRPKTDSAKAKMSEAQQRLNNDDPDRQKRLSEGLKKYIGTHGHPKGFKGHKRTEKEIQKMSDGARAAWANPKHEVNSPGFRQAISDRSAKSAASRPTQNAYSRAKSGWVKLGGKRFFSRSQWEANYGRFLEWQKQLGAIAEWEHEPHTFWFTNILRGVRSYLPDFKVTLNNGRVEWHEVKGWMDAKSKTKIKRMAKYYPYETLRIIGASWFKDANKKLSSIVPEWAMSRTNSPSKRRSAKRRRERRSTR